MEIKISTRQNLANFLEGLVNFSLVIKPTIIFFPKACLTRIVLSKQEKCSEHHLTDSNYDVMVKNITQHKGQGHHQADLLPNDHDRGLQDDHPKDLNGEPMIITARSKNGSPANRGAAAPPCSGGGSPPRFCDYNCDRTTSEMRGLSPKIISGDSRRSENAQAHTNTHTIPNMKFKSKLLQIKCHVLRFTKDKAPKCASKDNQSFCGSIHLSHDRHTLFVLEESEPPRMTYTCESQ
jgi:hypothetical protein